MKRIPTFTSLAVFMFLVTAAGPTNAQASRSFVSSLGDDANACTRSAPCRTFAGAIAKTSAGGEINVIDSASFGSVTITKSITIANDGVGTAGVQVSSTDAITISAGSSDIVVLRGLDIEGLGTGLSGIKVQSAGVVHVENCTINNFTQIGIDFVPTSATITTSQLHVSNSIIRDNKGAASGGIRIKPGANVAVIGMIENTQLKNNAFGLRVEDNSRVTAKNTTAAGNSFSGFIAVSAALLATLNLDSCVATGNGSGIKADNPNAIVRFASCTIAGNTIGLFSNGGGHLTTFTGSNNNADNSSPTDSIARQ